MTKLKGLGIFSSLLAAAFKSGTSTTINIKSSIVQDNKHREIKERNEQLRIKKMLTASKSLFDKMDSLIEEQEREIKKIRLKSKVRQRDFNKVMMLRNQAMDFEKEGKLELALNKHLKSIELGESSTNIHYANISFGIKRSIILYGKLKDYKSLRSFLLNCMSKYPEVQDIDDWKKRLSKIKST